MIYAAMRRLVFSNGDAKVGNEYVYHEDAPDVALDMGPITTDLWSLPLLPCPDCNGEVVWAEAGYAPGTRACTSCGSLFTIERWEQTERLPVLVRQWQRERDRARMDEIEDLDAAHAARMGLPILAALCSLSSRMRKAGTPISRDEMLAELAPLLQIARGEAKRRCASHGAAVEIPGLATNISGDVL